ncbi:hypothetical protein [Thauera sinica]|uniref:Lipoprotein n=1 Tax=Thauera sinica TaxID=2665146 RepID=A0ABW1AMH3_9RHOO|nr:hypothetical protein [Thauera sp. K11]
MFRPAGRGSVPAGCRIAVWVLAGVLTGCSSPGSAPKAGKLSSYAPQHLLKTDLNRVAEAHQQQIFASLRRLAVRLYKRNPREWRKSGADSLEAAVARIFDEQHHWRFEALGNRRDLEALRVALHPEFRGDRVQAFVVGLGSMVQTAFGDREEFFILDALAAQHLYNAARNIEIAAWKLSAARDERGGALLLSNQTGDAAGSAANLSFEREFGRIIGSLDTLADVVEEQTERTVTRVVQNLATAVFLPVH